MKCHIDYYIDINDAKEMAYDNASYSIFLLQDTIHKVELEKQKTGYGEKVFMKCCNCGSRRTKLYLYNQNLVCRNCYPINVYRKLQHVTTGGTEYITYKMHRFATKCGINFERHPFHYYNYEIPKHKHTEKYVFNLTILQALANMRLQSIFNHRIWDKETVDSVLNGTNAALYIYDLEELDQVIINFDMYVQLLNEE